MMKLIITSIFAVLLAFNSYSQQQDTVFIKYNKDWTSDTIVYTTDTIVFRSGMARHILTGTEVLPFTHNQQNAKGFGIYLDKVAKSDCKSHGEEIYTKQDEINSIIITDSTLSVDINIYDNCCYDFLCDISVDKSGTLNLIYYGYGTYCSCNCCFGLTYNFSRIYSGEYGNRKIKSVMLNGKKETLKKVK